MICDQCGKQLIRKQKRFCSRKCFVHYKAENPNEYKTFNLKQWHKDNPKLSKKAKEKHREAITGKACPWKGAKRPPGNYTLPPVYKGESHPCWQGGRWIYWRKFILGRDDYTCQHCGLRDKIIMDVDHIKPIRKSGKEREDMQLASIEAHGGVENLQTLCPNCHKRKTISDNYSGEYKSR